MDFRLCTVCVVAIGIILMVDQLKAEEPPSEATEMESQENVWSDSNYEIKKRSKTKDNSKLERTYQLDGKKKKYKKQIEDMNAFNQYKKNYKDQKSLKKERKRVFEKNKVKEEIYANGYVDSSDTLNDNKNTKGKKHKFSGEQTVEPTQSKVKLLKKQGEKKSTEGSSEYENREKEVKKFDCTGGKQQKKGRCSLSNKMQTCGSCEGNGRPSKYIKKLKNKSEHFENSVENLDEPSSQGNLENCETADNTETNLRGTHGRKIKRMYVEENEYEAGINEGYSSEIDDEEEEDDLAFYNLDENESLKSKGKIRRYIVEEEFIEDSTINE